MSQHSKKLVLRMEQSLNGRSIRWNLYRKLWNKFKLITFYLPFYFWGLNFTSTRWFFLCWTKILSGTMLKIKKDTQNYKKYWLNSKMMLLLEWQKSLVNLSNVRKKSQFLISMMDLTASFNNLQSIKWDIEIQ